MCASVFMNWLKTCAATRKMCNTAPVLGRACSTKGYMLRLLIMPGSCNQFVEI